MKKIILNSLSTVVIGFALTLPVVAQSTTPVTTGTLHDLRKDVRQDRRETRQDVKTIKQTTKNKLAAIIAGQVSATNGTTLIVTKDGKTYTVNTDGTTLFKRHFWGKSSLSEISVGDTVNVHGKFTDDAQTTILAKLVRDVSIQKRFGVFFGDILSISGNSIVIKSINRGNQTVTVSSTTKIVNRREQTIAQTDLQVGHRVRVRGMWDKASKTITEVSHIKDFSLPVQSVSSSPTP